MNIKNIFFFIIIFLFNGELLSQSFEKQYQVDSLININLKSNENIAYINNEGLIIFFNSSFNSNNVGGINDKNDVWYTISISGEWQKPNNLNKVNSTSLKMWIFPLPFKLMVLNTVFLNSLINLNSFSS